MTSQSNSLHIHLDIVGGIAGDMFISAMLDIFEYLQPEVLATVASVLPKEAGAAVLTTGINAGISGLRFKLQTPEEVAHAESHVHSAEGHSHSTVDAHEHHHAKHEHEQKQEHEQEHSHEHSHPHDHNHNHNHSHEHSHDHEHEHTHHHHTTYKYLCELLRESALKPDITQIAIDLLTIIGIAEAKIHAKTLDDVHFHELADWDSLMDVVASATILQALSDSSWSISKLPLGGGLVNTQHGLIPAPAPATAEILIGFEFFDDGIQGERITPTGASILRYLSNKQLLKPKPQGSLQGTGYGLGTKLFPGMPNILRAMSFNIQINTQTLSTKQSEQQDSVVIIEFDIDDMTGEELAHSLDLIRAQQGVVDVVVQSARGKKNRAVELIRLMAATTHYQDIIDFCFIQTTTIGLRYRFESRSHLPRIHHEREGNSFKSVSRPDGIKTTKIEHDQLTSLSTLHERRMKKYTIESA